MRRLSTCSARILFDAVQWHCSGGANCRNESVVKRCSKPRFSVCIRSVVVTCASLERRTEKRSAGKGKGAKDDEGRDGR